jgi:hypothetical protein
LNNQTTIPSRAKWCDLQATGLWYQNDAGAAIREALDQVHPRLDLDLDGGGHVAAVFCPDTTKNGGMAAVPETGPSLAQQYAMSEDEKGATEADMQKIDVIRGAESLGYEGVGREEHSGENSPKRANTAQDELADNKPEDI